ncbi:MAG: hypothetical protein NDI61_11915, partial [Bdellovibrionaceae bacterium]|nr:hypothetical protein [Pseudobdellovibrionaceae bacterium]
VLTRDRNTGHDQVHVSTGGLELLFRFCFDAFERFRFVAASVAASVTTSDTCSTDANQEFVSCPYSGAADVQPTVQRNSESFVACHAEQPYLTSKAFH